MGQLNHPSDKTETQDLVASVTGSLLFHVLLIAILASTHIFFIPAGKTDRIDVFWFLPPFLSASSPEVAEVGQAEAAPVAAEYATRSEMPHPQHFSADSVSKKESLPEQRPPAPAPTTAQEPEPADTDTSADEDTPEPEAEMKYPAPPPVEPKRVEAPKPPVPAVAPKPPVPAVAPKTPVPVITPRPAPASKPAEEKKDEKKREAVARNTEKSLQSVTSAPVKTAAIVPPSAQKPVSKEKPTAPKPAVQKQDPVTPTQPSGANEPASPRKVASPAVNQGQVAPAISPSSSLGHIAEPKSNGKPLSNEHPSPPKVVAANKAGEKKADPPQETKGLAVPPLIGDLKLEMVNRDDKFHQVKIAVVYREYPRNRRNRPMTKSEAQRVQTLTPLLARPRENTLEAVIEVTRDGIYEFRLLNPSAPDMEANYNVILHENSPRARTKKVGQLRLGHNGTIVKVLMPEGILWSEEAAFTGNLEDSDSITKFNSDSGLVWKEYK